MATASAFIDFYERNAEPVLLFFTRRTLDAEVALDLTAETFAQAWRGWSRVRPDSVEEVQGWLFTIARRQLGRYLRRGRVERGALNQLGFSVPGLADDEIADIERAAGLEPTARARVSRGLRALAAALEPVVSDQRSTL